MAQASFGRGGSLAPTNALKKTRVCFTGTSGRHSRCLCSVCVTCAVNLGLVIYCFFTKSVSFGLEEETLTTQWIHYFKNRFSRESMRMNANFKKAKSEKTASR